MTLKESAQVLSKKAEWNLDQLNSIERVYILKTSWYEEVIDSLVLSAKEYLFAQGLKENVVVEKDVPGALELPLAARFCAEKKEKALILALGCVLKGSTPHFDFVCMQAFSGLLQVQQDFSVPMGIGVLTVETLDQAQERRLKGAEAAQAALTMYHLKQNLKGAL